MRKIIFMVFFILAYSYQYALSAPYDAFDFVLNGIYNSSGNKKTKEKIAQKYLDDFAKDAGQAISGGSQGVGGTLKILDSNLSLSIKMSYQDVSKDNKIVRTTGEKAIFYPIVQAEIGFLEKFNAITRISYFNDSLLLGGGLRYEIYKSEDEMYIPTISVQSIYNYLINDNKDYGKFNLRNLKTGTTAYFELIPYIQPYVFITYDITTLSPITSKYAYLSSTVHGFGYGLGANLKIEPLNLNFAISLYDNQPNISFGIFIGI